MTCDQAVEEVLSRGELEVHGRIAESSNTALLVTVRSGADEVLAIFKPERGERALWDFPPGLWRREVACYELDRLLGAGCVPLTVARLHPQFGPGSLQRWVHEDGTEHYLSLRGRTELHDWFRRLAALDVVANNTDRKSGHVLFDGEGRCWAIDNGLCFHRQPKLRTVIWEFAGEPLPEPVLADLAALGGKLPGRLCEWLSAGEMEALSARAARLVRRGRFPVPDPDTYHYPWPMV